MKLHSAMIAGILAASGMMMAMAEETFKPTVREVPEEAVLFTVFCGSFENVGQAIGRLYGVAGQKGMRPLNPLSFTYLNDHQAVSNTQWQTEIRIPVAKNAVQYKGTLGKGADVKIIPARMMAVTIKEPGQSDQGAIREQLLTWAAQNGYTSTGIVTEIFLSNAQSGDYAQMRSQIMVPITRIPAAKPSAE